MQDKGREEMMEKEEHTPLDNEESSRQLSRSKKALFLPYKASMWDSLEGVWKKYDKDPALDASLFFCLKAVCIE